LKYRPIFRCVPVQTGFPTVNQLFHFQQLLFVGPDASALRAFVQNDPARLSIIKVLHPDIFAAGTIQLVVIVLLSGKNFPVQGVQRSGFFRAENLVVMFYDSLQFARLQPFSLATGAGFNCLAVVFNRLEY
jgi:hypothetical protein